MKLIEGLIIRSASKVSVIHQRFAEYLVSTLDVPEGKVSVIRNWTHVEPNGPFDRAAVRQQHGWENDEIIVLHAGNMGMKQGLENVIEAGRLAETRGSKVRFVLLGDGNQRPRLQALSNGLTNVQFLAPVSNESFIPTLRSADVLLVNEMAGLKEMSVPSKLTSYFAAGQPVIAATEPNSTTATEIESSKAGLLVPTMDPEALLAAAERLGQDAALSEGLGSAGMKFSQEHLSEAAAIRYYDSWVRELATMKA
jgi:glycosyltransferase involved in cell wall biosynthesis